MALPVLYGVVRLKRIPPDPRLPEFENVVAVGTDLSGLIKMNPGWRESKAWGLLRPAAVASVRRWRAHRLAPPRRFG